MTKEEIIGQFEPMGEYPTYYHESEIEKMMDIFSEQESIAFAEWMHKYAGRYIGKGIWRVGHLLRRSTAELYQLFKQQTKK